MKAAGKAAVIGNMLAFVASLTYRECNSAASYYIRIQDLEKLRFAYPMDCLGMALAQPIMIALIRTMGYKIGLSIVGAMNVMTLVLSLTLNENTIMFTIIFGGFAVGSTYISLISYYAEISKPKHRAFMIISVFIVYIYGHVMYTLMFQFLSYNKIMTIFSLLGIGFIILVPLQLPESPYFLKRKNKPNVEETISLLKGSDCDSNDIQEIEDVLQTKSNNSLKIYAVAILAIASQFVGYDYFIQIILPLNQVQIITFLINMFGILVAAGICMVMKKSVIIIVSCAVTLIIYIILLTTQILSSDSSVIVNSIWIFFFNIGLKSIPRLLLIETIPLNSKPINLAIYSTLAAIMPFIFKVVIISSEYGIMFRNDLIYAFMVMLCLSLVMAFFVPVTKGKTLAQLQKELSAE